MDPKQADVALHTALATLTEVGLKIVGALVLYIVGRWLIGAVGGLLQSNLEKQKIDPTLVKYGRTAISVLLNVALVVSILGYFGVQTTTFAALLAGAGIAIGTAWSGLLSNFASGAFLIVLKPFKVGDFVTVGDITGTVRDIGIFTVTLDTPDNVKTVLGNSKVFSGTIQNFSSNKVRRVELLAQLHHSVDVNDAMTRLREALAKIPDVSTEQRPEVDILTFTDLGPVLAVRPYTHTDTYWPVYFATNKAIVEVSGQAGYPAPERRLHLKNVT